MIRRLSRSLATSAATLALATALAGPVNAQGVPTVDTQNIAQEVRQLQQMLQDFGIQTDLLDNALEQLQVVQDQLDQLQEMYAALTGPRSILGMVMGDGLDGLLEAKFSDLPGLIRGIQTGDWSNLLGITAGPMRTQMEQALARAGFDEDSLHEIATSGNPGAEGVATRADDRGPSTVGRCPEQPCRSRAIPRTGRAARHDDPADGGPEGRDGSQHPCHGRTCHRHDTDVGA